MTPTACIAALHMLMQQMVFVEGSMVHITVVLGDGVTRFNLLSASTPDHQYSMEFTIASGSSNVANMICLVEGMEMMSPASAGIRSSKESSMRSDTSSSWSSYSVLMCRRGCAGVQLRAGLGSDLLTWAKVTFVAAPEVAMWL